VELFRNINQGQYWAIPGNPPLILSRILVMDLHGKISQANGRLAAGNISLRIEQNGKKLSLRGTLPPKPGSGRDRSHQQRIALGVDATGAGLKTAEARAREISGLIALGRFVWDEFLPGKPVQPEVIGDWIGKIEQDYLANGGRRETWNGDYLKIYRRLPWDKPVTAELMEATLAAIPVSQAKTRNRAVMALGKLARAAGVDCGDLRRYRRQYSPADTAPREIPTDEAIALHHNQICARNPAWGWVYGVMATYGLRNHEVFKISLDAFPVVRVGDDTKTGYHEVWPCYPEWAEEWRLHEPILPPVDTNRCNEKIGHSVTRYLSPKLPFLPYDLRHAWAIRTLEFGWPTELAAAQMGHSHEVHSQTYHRWISTRHHQRVFDLLVNRQDRPRPPANWQPAKP
jgi:integrase